MRIIDLLNKIANGEEVPKKIKYSNKKYEFIEGAYEDEEGKDLCYYDDSCMAFLTDEVEIIEDEENKYEKMLEDILKKHHTTKEEFVKWFKDFINMIDKINEVK